MCKYCSRYYIYENIDKKKLNKKRATSLLVFREKNQGNVKGMPRRVFMDQITIKTPVSLLHSSFLSKEAASATTR